MLDKIDKALALAFRYELHAFVLLLTGVALYLHGAKEPGSAVIGSALLVFKGKN
jgi:hypothetical protein